MVASGQVLESMHVKLQRGESRLNFSIWVYGDGPLARGSGLHIGRVGIACNHHYLLPDDGADLRLLAGKYTLRVSAKRVTDAEPRQLTTITLSMSESNAKEVETENAGIYFDWGPDHQAYHPLIEIKKPRPLPPWLMDAAGVSQQSSSRHGAPHEVSV